MSFVKNKLNKYEEIIVMNEAEKLTSKGVYTLGEATMLILEDLHNELFLQINGSDYDLSKTKSRDLKSRFRRFLVQKEENK